MASERTVRIETYFRELSSGSFSARTLLVDMDSVSLDEIRSSPFGAAFMGSQNDNFLSGQMGTFGNFALSLGPEGRDLVERTMESLRRELEFCDSPQGVQLICGVSGGTGSGIGKAVRERIGADFGTTLEMLKVNLLSWPDSREEAS